MSGSVFVECISCQYVYTSQCNLPQKNQAITADMGHYIKTAKCSIAHTKNKKSCLVSREAVLPGCCCYDVVRHQRRCRRADWRRSIQNSFWVIAKGRCPPIVGAPPHHPTPVCIQSWFEHFGRNLIWTPTGTLFPIGINGKKKNRFQAQKNLLKFSKMA